MKQVIVCVYSVSIHFQLQEMNALHCNGTFKVALADGHTQGDQQQKLNVIRSMSWRLGEKESSSYISKSPIIHLGSISHQGGIRRVQAGKKRFYDSGRI